MSPRRTRARRAAAAALLVVAVTVAIDAGPLTALDTAVARVVDRHHDPMFHPAALAGFRLGQSYVLPAAAAVLALLLVRRWRTPRPLLGVAAVWLVHSASVGALKLWAGRQAPGSGNVHLHAATAELSERMSYPCGHAANIVVFTAVVGVLLTALTNDPRWGTRLVALATVSGVLCVTGMIYLGFHWATDAVAGLALGAALRGAMIPALTAYLAPPGRRAHPAQPVAPRT